MLDCFEQCCTEIFVPVPRHFLEMTPRNNTRLSAQYLKRLQDEFKDFPKNEVKDLFTEKGNNFQISRNALLKMRSKGKENESSSKIGGLGPNLLKSYLGQENFSQIEDFIEKKSEEEIQKVNSKKLYGLEFGENEKHLLKNNFRLIDQLVRERNVPLDRISQLKPDQLIFDLHYFSIEGAKQFVREVAQRTSGPELQLVTGMGSHSKSGESAIKKMLMEVYGKRIQECQGNKGKVTLTL
ncbi:unnamed protein product [Caenorhabditis brenneri]